MTKPGPALTFYLKHGDDVAALVESESAPQGVSEDDWGKFNRVVALANEEVAQLLDACRVRIVQALGDAIVPIGNGAARKRLPQTWDAWREFKGPGRKKAAFGWLGANLIIRNDGWGTLVGYLRPKVTDAGLRDALGIPAPSAEQLADWSADTALVFQLRVEPDTDLARAVEACGEAFTGVRSALAAYLARPGVG